MESADSAACARPGFGASPFTPKPGRAVPQMKGSPIMRRRGFTLVELLVVIAIIGVLMSLLLAAVTKVSGRAEEVKTRADITQLAIGIQSFQTKYSVDYPPPSRILLRKRLSDYRPTGATPDIEADSKAFLLKLWPRLDQTVPIDWDGNTSTPATASWLLEGHECLVFFLGGIPTNQAGLKHCSGFSPNPSDPSSHIKNPPEASNTNKFFDFADARLRERHDYNGGAPTGFPFWAYADGYGKVPYAYFSSYKGANGYNRYGYKRVPADTAVSDCSLLPAGVWNLNSERIDPATVWPYATIGSGGPNYHNPNGYQIVSAGRDKLFGQGSVLPIGSGPFFIPRIGMYPAPRDPGNDDLANFSDKLLGIPPN